MSMPSKQKVYQGVLKEIRQFIDSNDLQPGDKLPSERELAENLQAGRSSIREALRAMELLGLIETRHGEGTFLSTYRPHQTVELLSSFILQGDQVKVDLVETIRLLEKEAVKLVLYHLTEKEVSHLSTIINATYTKQNARHAAFFTYIFEKTNNLLLWKVWHLMFDFATTVENVGTDKSFYIELIQIFLDKDHYSIDDLFDTVPNKS
ncbi:GntR family transcriptional regulator [Virgibacillus massiliensis]|nr:MULTISPECIES: GntR family transcriptional regulator [Virgibacillus]MYL41524.1 GntR family transcriptional regulator [Virgibacillus massiliensis]